MNPMPEPRTAGSVASTCHPAPDSGTVQVGFASPTEGGIGVTVFAAGHWLLAHDNVGPRVLAALGGRLGPEVEVRDVGTIGLDLLDHLSGQELAVIVDACSGLAAPGDVLVKEPELALPQAPTASVHQIGPVEALMVARLFYPENLPRKTLLVLVETRGLDGRDEEAAVLRAVETVVAVVDAHRRAVPCSPQPPRR